MLTSFYTESPNKRANEREQKKTNRCSIEISHTTFCLSISGALIRVHNSLLFYSTLRFFSLFIFDMDCVASLRFIFLGKYCFLCVKHCKISMNSVELVLSIDAIVVRHVIYLFIYIAREIEKKLSAGWNRFGCWVFNCRFDSAFTMSFDVLLYIHRCRPMFVVELLV